MNIIKNIYFYLFAAVGLVFVLIGLVQLIQLGLRAYVFPQADVYVSYPMPKAERSATSTEPTEEELAAYQEKQQASNRQREATTGISFLLVGLPLFWVHFRVIKKDL